MSVESILKNLDESLNKALDHLHNDFAGLQIGRASGALVERIQVESYGTMQPLKAVASISVPDAKTVQIQPWDRSQLAGIEKAIQMSELGLTPSNDGLVIRLNIPDLTEERRRELTKLVHKMAEETKIAVRNSRQEAMNKIKQLKNNSEITEDIQQSTEKKIQEKVDEINHKIEEAAKAKEQDILKV
ncbi:ribosome recycling factor [Candidatus Peregrinibacteria bacterium]|nr:ribosome recycling factor [Candidatus Peregrinibacteria bacterium]